MGKDTLVSIAEKAGCSVSTVSRVLGGNASKYRISQKTIDRVMKEAEKADYTPSLLAKGLRTKKTDTIGLVLPSIENTFFAHIASVLVSEAKNYNYQIILADTQENEENEVRNISTLLARNVDGLVVIPCGSSPEKYNKILKKGVPIVLMDRCFLGLDSISNVSTDNYSGARLATEHLISKGHRNIVFIQGTPFLYPSKSRADGYRDTMKEHGLEQFISVSGDDFSVQNGYIEAKLLLSRKVRPTAIFAGSNQITLGCIKAIKEAGLKVPEDISLIAFDDNILFDYLEPGITCIAQPIEEMSLLALKILIDQIESDSAPVSVLIPPRIVARNSIKKLQE